MKSLLSNYSISATGNWKKFANSARAAAQKIGRTEIEGLSGSACSFFAATVIEEIRLATLSRIQYRNTGRSRNFHDGGGFLDSSALDFVVVAPTEREVREIHEDLETAFGDCVEFREFPAWDSAPYRPLARGSSVFGKRSGTLAALASNGFGKSPLGAQSVPRIFLASQRSLSSPVPPPESLRKLIFPLFQGQKFDPAELSERLSSLGYTRVPKVGVPGEFTLRGEVLDVFTPGEKLPTRINFDFDEIESVRSFSTESQSTAENLGKVLIYPMKEVVWSEDLISRLESEFAAGDFSDSAREKCAQILEELRTAGEAEGEELFYPVLDGKRHTFLDYAGKDATFFFFDHDRLLNAQEGLEREFSGMYKKARQELPVFSPAKTFVRFDDALECLSEGSRRVFFRSLKDFSEDSDSTENSVENSVEDSVEKAGNPSKISIEMDSPQSFFGNFAFIREKFSSLFDSGWRILIFADNENQSLRIGEIFRDFTDSEKPLSIFPKAISSGFGIQETRTLVVQENEIFGRRKHTPRGIRHAKSEAIDTFVDLNPGDYVVHVNYGIGLFKGIQRLKTSLAEKDYIKIEYAKEEFLYVPLEQMNLVQRYIGNGGNAPALDTLGGKSWENRKNRVRQAVEEMAEKLVSLYSKRKISRGFAFARYPDLEAEFDAAFPYEDTPDQYTVTKEIKADMERPVPMDRLLCGDVGYGKTEIAMRAAFKAVLSKKQVAFLAPTTILAEQHYETCVERFEKFPVVIKQLSRFVSPKEQRQVLKELSEGKIDILVGTHRIIQKDVVFQDLGLMIIDEEQRFGVKDKERLKAMRTSIDCLSMSATPIPRTLHMSLLKIRDMSLLTTPPQTRKPIETFVDEYSEEKVARAIRLEVERGGQVFFLHNRVETLNETCRRLERLCPEMMIDCAHGQMSAEELDDIFRRFKMGGFHVLVATTIIENGIDIPNVNTIIIDRADMYGISQLYQLRGRVGRSDRKAFAYLLYPENRALSETAMKRLQAISDFTELGSGFKIAMKDMEIRGAGNLLGRDQSGDVYSVGFDLYVRLLTEAINKLNKEGYRDDRDPLIELEYTGFIPDTYITSVQTKMEIYKKAASVRTKDDLDSLLLEIEDRFGPIPDEVYSLLSLAEVRIIAKRLSVDSLREKDGIVTVAFRNASDIPLDKFMRMWSSNQRQVRPNPARQNEFSLVAGKIGLREKGEFIKEMLEKLL